MKIWNGYGSEHSSNLVMIGHFKTVDDAKKAEKFISELTEEVVAGSERGEIVLGRGSKKFSASVLDFFSKHNIMSISNFELEQLLYEVNTERKSDVINITTEEIDVSVFMKIMVEYGARVEVFSAHDYPEAGLGRGASGE